MFTEPYYGRESHPRNLGQLASDLVQSNIKDLHWGGGSFAAQKSKRDMLPSALVGWKRIYDLYGPNGAWIVSSDSDLGLETYQNGAPKDLSEYDRLMNLVRGLRAQFTDVNIVGLYYDGKNHSPEAEFLLKKGFNNASYHKGVYGQPGRPPIPDGELYEDVYTFARDYKDARKNAGEGLYEVELQKYRLNHFIENAFDVTIELNAGHRLAPVLCDTPEYQGPYQSYETRMPLFPVKPEAAQWLSLGI